MFKCFLIYKEDYPWDVRVEKLATSLSKAGHEVTIICRNHGQKPVREDTPNFRIRRLPVTRLLPSFLVKLLNFPYWFNPLWLWTIFDSSRGASKPIFIVRDLPLVKAGLLVGKLRRAPVVYDMAEVYPEMYASILKFSESRVPHSRLKSPFLAKRYERAILFSVDHTLVMIEESRDRLIKKGISPDKVTIVSNTPLIEKFDNEIHIHKGQNLRIVYVGFITKLRGLDLLIKAAHEYLRNGNSTDSIQIDIVGKGEEKARLIQLVEELKLGENVKIHGWLSQDEVDHLMARANVGALTYRVCGHWNHTIPNKIFDYMLAGLPVLATEVIPVKRIVSEANCGVICEDLNPVDIAKKLKMLTDPNLRNLYGTNGYKAVVESYNWRKDEANLLSAIHTTTAEYATETENPI